MIGGDYLFIFSKKLKQLGIDSSILFAELEDVLSGVDGEVGGGDLLFDAVEGGEEVARQEEDVQVGQQGH